MIEQIDPNHYLRQLEDIRDGDIICFQRWEGGEDGGEEGRGRERTEGGKRKEWREGERRRMEERIAKEDWRRGDGRRREGEV